MFFMGKNKDAAASIVGELINSKKREADVEMPVPEDAEDAAISALVDAIHSKDSASVKQHLRSWMDVWDTQEDSKQPTPPGSELERESE